jgi:hypothetical protein
MEPGRGDRLGFCHGNFSFLCRKLCTLEQLMSG